MVVLLYMYLFLFINCKIRLIEIEREKKIGDFNGLFIQKTFNETHIIINKKYSQYQIIKYSNDDLFLSSEEIYNNYYYIKNLESENDYMCDNQNIFENNLKNFDYIENERKNIFNEKSFLILKNNSLVVINQVEYYGDKYLNFSFFDFPIRSTPDYSYLNKNIKISNNKYTTETDFKIIEIQRGFLLINNNTGYLLDSSFKTLNIYEKLLNENLILISMTNLYHLKNNIIVCYQHYINYKSRHKSIKCQVISIKNNRILKGDMLEIIENKNNFVTDISLSLIGHNKIAMVINERKSGYELFRGTYYESKLYLTYINFQNNALKIGSYKNIYIPLDITDHTFSFINLNYLQDEGLVLYFMVENSDNQPKKVVKAYIEEKCISETLNDIIPYEKNLIDFRKIISLGIAPKNTKIKITYTEDDYKLYKDNKIIKKGRTININDKIYIKPNDTNKVMKLNYSFSGKECQLSFNNIKSFIYIKNEKHICMIDNTINEINNITNHDMEDIILYDKQKSFIFSINFQNKVRQNDLIFYLLDKRINCSEDILDDHQVWCQGLIPYNYTQTYYITSKLSCKNTINVAKFTVKDKYLLDIYEIEDMEKITSKLNPDYNPGEVIRNFSVNMISYYIWFSGFAYCDNDKISKFEFMNKCCNSQNIIKKYEWEVIEQKEYSLIKKLDYQYIYNFVILKSKTYKKYLFAFPGTTSIGQLIQEGIDSELVIFDRKDNKLKVEKFFYKIFETIYKDLFSSKIIKELYSNPEYQIIFTGHSLGGAIATLSSYYYANKKLAKNEPVLITFGQPRVGNEIFARKYMKLIKLVFRVARKNDIVTMLPPSNPLGKNKFFDAYNLLASHYAGKDKNIKESSKKETLWGKLKNTYEKSMEDIKESLKFSGKYIATSYINDLIKKINPVYGYCHIGGLYLLMDNKFYHCADFFNEETNHPICKNYEINSIGDIGDYSIDNHGYLRYGEDVYKLCQKDKKFRFDIGYLFF